MLTRFLREGARELPVILDPRRATRAENLGRHRRAVERPARAGLDALGMLTMDREHGHHGAPVVIAADRGIQQAQDFGDLLRDGLEYFSRRRTPGHERRHAAQCRLLLCKRPTPMASVTRPDVLIGSRYSIIGGVTSGPTRVVLADDDVLLREGLPACSSAPAWRS
jgi:hypothetical protein